jgi:hypothetical protein
MSGFGGHCVVEDFAVVGAMSGIHQFVRIGESAFTAGNSMVTKDVPPFTKVAGDRARFVGVQHDQPGAARVRQGADRHDQARLSPAVPVEAAVRHRVRARRVRVRRVARGAPPAPVPALGRTRLRPLGGSVSSGEVLGLIAGQGVFPLEVARTARRRGVRVACVALRGQTRPEIEGAVESIT